MKTTEISCPNCSTIMILVNDSDAEQISTSGTVRLDKKGRTVPGSFKPDKEDPIHPADEESLRRFTKIMRKKLAKHPDWNWDNCDIDDLLHRLMEEVFELVRALEKDDAECDNHVAVGEECADVANFAMGIAYLAGALR